MQARARGMLARKHDAKELAAASTVTKAEAKAERQRALGKVADEHSDSTIMAAGARDCEAAVGDLSETYEEDVVDDALETASGSGAAHEPGETMRKGAHNAVVHLDT